MAGNAKGAGPDRTWKFTTRNFVVTAVMMLKRTSLLYARDVIPLRIAEGKAQWEQPQRLKKGIVRWR
jgi:hypothetical protein